MTKSNGIKSLKQAAKLLNKHAPDGESLAYINPEEAKLLKEANENAELKIVENMNHVLFIIEGDDLENSKSYNESFRPISEELIESITSGVLILQTFHKILRVHRVSQKGSF